MKSIICLSILIVFITCKKQDKLPSDDELNVNNKINLRVTSSSGTIINIISRGSQAPISVGTGYGLYIDGNGLNPNDPTVKINAGLNWPGVAGTYSWNCEYRPTGPSSGINVYANWLSSNRGSITFTSLEEHYAKGYFDGTCKLNSDSVYLSGDFEGYIKHY